MSTLYGLSGINTTSDALRKMEDVESNLCVSQLITLHTSSGHADTIFYQIRRLGVDTTYLITGILGKIARFHTLDVLRVTSIYIKPSNHLQPYSEKLLIKTWNKNAKNGGWGVKIPRLDFCPAFVTSDLLPYETWSDRCVCNTFLFRHLYLQLFDARTY